MTMEILTPLFTLKMREVFVLDGTMYAVMFPDPTSQNDIQCIRLAIVTANLTGELTFLYTPSATIFINKNERVQKLRMV